MTFREWLVEMNFSDEKAMGHLSKHPAFDKTTVGVEIEFVDTTKREDSPEENIESAVDDVRDDLDRMITGAGFKFWGSEKGQEGAFGIGGDGMDDSQMYGEEPDDGRPIIEIRSSHMKMSDMNKFRTFLVSLVDYVKSHDHLEFNAHTGFHVHVSNPDMANDPFSKLAASLGVDENHIWNDLATHDRNFERFARLNRQQDFSSYNDTGVHQSIIYKFDNLQNGESEILTMDQFLSKIHTEFDRKIGTNYLSRVPTVEYRYLPSVILNERSGVDKAMKYINYFVLNTISKQNKNQFTLKDSNHHLTFTRLPGNMVRVDYRVFDEEEEYGKKISQSGFSTKNLRGYNQTRPPDMGMGDWRHFDANSYKNYLRTKVPAKDADPADPGWKLPDWIKKQSQHMRWLRTNHPDA